MHGRPRATQGPDPARQKHEEAKTASFQSLLQEVLHNHRQRNFSKEALLQNAKLLETNPEVYTAWNYRKLAVTYLLESQHDESARKSLLDVELHVIERALMRNFKSYGAWHHRKWVLHFGLSSLDHEYRLLDKLLNSDARNFHGWDYRRFLARVKKATEEQELQYTIKKIDENFSNYSAWHYRSVLLSKQLLDKVIVKDNWLEVLTEEYELVKQAFFTEPEDQSGWFYLMWLLSETVIPSRPLLAGFWPSNGASVLLDSGTISWSYKSPFSKKAFCNNCAPCIILCFSKPVCGVNTKTVSLKTTPEAQPLESGVSWNPLSNDAGASRIWTANITDSCKGFENGTLYTLHVDIGARPGITSNDGSFLGVNQDVNHFSFNLEVCSPSDAACGEHPIFDGCVAWPAEDCEKSFSKCEHSMEDVLDDLLLEYNRHLEPISDWQMETLKSQIDTCRELLDLEKDSKWAMLILARLLTAHDNVANSQKPYIDEVRQLYRGLVKVDPTHGHYYDEQLSLLMFDQITRSLHNLSEHWCELQRPNKEKIHWLRLNNLSLSKLGYFERLIGVQRLDLSNNKLRSLEGIETLQLLINLDVSHNRLSSVTTLLPISSLPKLEALNIKCNEIGVHTIDTNRYLFSSALNNSIESNSGTSRKHQNGPHYWEILQVFSGMGLKQLDMHGNPISTNDFCKRQIVQALPYLVWLDGVKISN
eukprot:c22544_g1_i1 orf=223-2334(-)